MGELSFSSRLLGIALAMAIISCNSSNGPAECVAAGGACLLGPESCRGTKGPQDCNPDHNPGGAFCCLPCPSGQEPADGGLPVTGCH